MTKKSGWLAWRDATTTLAKPGAKFRRCESSHWLREISFCAVSENNLSHGVEGTNDNYYYLLTSLVASDLLRGIVQF